MKDFLNHNVDDLEREAMKQIQYTSDVGNLMYAHVCTRPDIAYAVSFLRRFQLHPGMDHQRTTNKVMRYIQRTKDLFILVFNNYDDRKLLGIPTLILQEALMTCNLLLTMCFKLIG